MVSNSPQESAILIDLKKRRIRIHENTIRALHNPEYIVLLVHPEERTLAVMCSQPSDKRAHRVPIRAKERCKSYELYSTSLIQNLLALNPEWVDNFSYRMVGQPITNKGMVMFHMSQASPIETVKDGRDNECI